jgi:hypothetical protein
MLLVLALATLGLGYAHWEKLLDIKGTVGTGTVNADFDSAKTNDPIIEPGKDLDPGYDKDVASCEVFGVGTQVLTVTIKNGYPSYSCAVDFTITNKGTIPVKVNDFDTSAVPPALTVTWTDLPLGTQIEPGKEAHGDIHIHVEQIAAQDSKFEFSAKIRLVQWNLYPLP